MALTDKLTAIADGFRASRGTEDKYTLDQMAVLAAEPIGGGGGGDLPEEAFNVTGNCQYRFANGGWDWFLKDYGNQVTTSNINNASYMFFGSSLNNIPFDINGASLVTLTYMFYNCPNLTSLPKIRGVLANGAFGCNSMLTGCERIRDIEELFSPYELEAFANVKITSQYSCPQYLQLNGLRSLRTIPTWFYKQTFSSESTSYPAATYIPYKFTNCNSLDEIVNLKVFSCVGEQTNNMFGSAFNYCMRAKNITFETNEDGSPKVTKWKNQTIDLSTRVGWASNYSDIVNSSYNNGITDDKYVSNDAQYQALKDDPDWFTISEEYCRYNHDSAVATINSLPDCSAYLATAGGTNTIKFRGSQGSKTDGGAINTLTEAEIAVATAKGWTVQLV